MTHDPRNRFLNLAKTGVDMFDVIGLDFVDVLGILFKDRLVLPGHEDKTDDSEQNSAAE